MNTNPGTRKYAQAFIAIVAVLLAFSSPAAADYSGDHPLTIYDHDTVNGSLLYETITDGGGYTTLNAIGSATYSQDITISIPAGATIKMARLYNTYCWSKSDFGVASVPGDPAEADLTFNGVKVTCQNPAAPIPNPIHYGNGVVHYWDTKNLTKYGGQYDYPSGEFAWDVTDMVTGSGTYTATIANNDSTPTPSEYFCTFGFGLLVMYEKPSSPEIEYWIAEGCDILMARTFETPENATTNATFVGSIDLSNVAIANLTAVTTCSDGGLMPPPKNMMYFNDVEIGPSTAVSDKAYGVNYFDVTSLLSSTQNVVEFQDRDDDHYVHNAFLVVRIDTTPPAGITNLSYTNGTTWINWTWTNPPDSDFNYTVVCLNGTWKTNTSNPFYNATNLAPDTPYEIGTRTVDKVGNINGTWVNDTAKTLPLPEDTTPPASITNLSSLNGTTWINWTWTNPPDSDFNHTVVYLNGTWKTNTSNPFYMATELTPNTLYEIGTRTVDEVGNINGTWVNGTAKTLPLPEDTTPPASITNLSSLNGTTWINWTWTNPPDSDFNYTVVYLNGIWKTNTPNPFYNATNLAPDTLYEIGTRTVDKVGNINDTWINGTAKTLPPDTTTTPYGYSTTGFPVATNETGTIKGGIYYKVNNVWPGTFLGSGSYEVSTSFDVPDRAIIGRLYTGVWGGSPFKTGNVTLIFNGHEYPVRKIKGNNDSPCGPEDTPGVYGSGCGVWANVYNVTPDLIPGASNSVYMKTNAPSSLPACSGSYGWDGRIYIMALVVVYENDSMPEITYWINEGAGLLLTGDSACGPGYSLTNFTVYFNGMIAMSNVSAARLWTLGFPHNCLPHPELNGNYIGDPNFTQSSSAYDFYRWDNLTSFLNSSNNNLYYYDTSPGYERVISVVFMVEHVKIVTNGFVAKPGTTQTSEWIELYNPTSSEVSLDGWTIGNGSGDTASLDGKTVPANGYLVLNRSAGDFSFWLNNDGDIIYLNKSATTVDKVAYGNWDDGNMDDNAPAPDYDQSTGRYPNGVDTDNDSADFREFGMPTPGALNIIPGSIVGRITYACNGTGIADVKVNLTKGSTVNTTVTNETGYYNFTNVVHGSYLVHASKLRFYDNSTEVTVTACETTTADMILWLKGDLNNDSGITPDAGDVELMLRASVGDISGDIRYDLNGNGEIADVGDVVLMLKASIKDIELL